MKIRMNHILFITTILWQKRVIASFLPGGELISFIGDILSWFIDDSQLHKNEDEKSDEQDTNKEDSESSSDEEVVLVLLPELDFSRQIFIDAVFKFLKSKDVNIENPYFDFSQLLTLIYNNFEDSKDMAIAFVTELYYKTSKFTEFESGFTENFLKKKEKLSMAAIEFYKCYENAKELMGETYKHSESKFHTFLLSVFPFRECYDATLKTLMDKDPNFCLTFDSMAKIAYADNIHGNFFRNVQNLSTKRAKIAKQLICWIKKSR